MGHPPVRLDRDGRYRCSLCTQTFKQKGKVQHHYRLFHAGRPAQELASSGPASLWRRNSIVPEAAEEDRLLDEEAVPVQVAAPAVPETNDDFWDDDELVVTASLLRYRGVVSSHFVTAMMLPLHVHAPTVSARIAAYYRSKGDLARTQLLVSSSGLAQESPFGTQALRKLRRIALGSSGSGMSRFWREKLWEGTVAAERETAKLCGRRRTQGPMEAAFPTAARWVRSLKEEQDRCLAVLGWRTTPIDIAGKTYVFYSRNAMDVAADALGSAEDVQIDVKHRADGVPVTRTCTLDSDLYRSADQEVRRLHSYKGRVFTLAIQLFSDASLVSHNGGTCVRAILR